MWWCLWSTKRINHECHGICHGCHDNCHGCHDIRHGYRDNRHGYHDNQYWGDDRNRMIREILHNSVLIIVRTRWWWSWWRRRDMNEKRYGRGLQLPGKSATIKVIPQRRSFRGLDCLSQSEAWIQSCWPMRSFHFQRQFCIRTICIGRVICNLQLADAKESDLWYIIEWVKGLCSLLAPSGALVVIMV